MLSELKIRNARPETKTRILWDQQVKGLGVRITPKGTKAYVLDYRMNGRRRQFFCAHRPSLNIIWSMPSRERPPLERRVRRIVAKVDSIGLLVRMLCQCGAGKS